MGPVDDQWNAPVHADRGAGSCHPPQLSGRLMLPWVCDWKAGVIGTGSGGPGQWPSRILE